MKTSGSLLLMLLLTACGPGEEADPWQVVFEDRDAALLSVWGQSSNDIWLVGADPDLGSGPDVLHFDGEHFSQLDSGATGDLWWVSGTADSVWMSGESGLLLRYDRDGQTFETMTLPTDATLFGVMPFASDDVWVVGGDARDNTGVLLHYDGVEWKEPDGLPEGALGAGQLFKVWGHAPDSVWIVGLGGIALHYNGSVWQAFDVPDGRRLFTVHGNANESSVVAVGGFIDGLVVDLSDGSLSDVTPSDAPQLNGVWVRDDGSAVAVGTQGSVWEKDGDSMVPLQTRTTSLDHHAVFVDETGAIWAVGGFIVSEPLRQGFLYRRGPPIDGEISP